MGDKSWMFNDVVSSFSRLYFIRSGNAYIERDGHRCPLRPGRMYLIPAGSRYNYVCTSQIEKFYIHFELELLPGVDLFNGLRDYLDAPCPESYPESLISLAQNGSLSSLLRLKSIFLDIISGFLEQAVKEKEYGIDYAGFYKQHETLAYITAHLNAGLRVSQISQALGIPPAYPFPQFPPGYGDRAEGLHGTASSPGSQKTAAYHKTAPLQYCRGAGFL